MEPSAIRLLIVLYAGDYRAAFQRLSAGDNETYHGHRYALESLSEISTKIEAVAVLCCRSEEPYDEVLSMGFRVIGAGPKPDKGDKKIIEIIAAYNPTHLVIRTPIQGIFRWAINNQIRTIGMLADSFQKKGLNRKVKNYFLAHLLNNSYIEWIGNHGINSCRSLQQIGVNPDKIIPWDWPHSLTPADFPPKQLRKDLETIHLIYVGSVKESKGVGDILEAVLKLKDKNLSVNLKIAGKGENETFIERAKQLNIQDEVEFLGLVPNNTIVNLMRESDFVLVPSRHEYPEGFPLTIYEAFCSRTPLIASDHPMFQSNLEHQINAMIFPAGNSTAIAACIEKLHLNPDLYHRLSLASYDAWKRLQIPVKWADFIKHWIIDLPENQRWLFEHRLASGRYDLAPSR